MIVASGLLVLAVGAAFAVLLVPITDLNQAERSARHFAEVLVVANRLERRMVDVQAGERGFVITVQENLLEQWRAAQAAVPEQARACPSVVPVRSGCWNAASTRWQARCRKAGGPRRLAGADRGRRRPGKATHRA
jgi:hypothetical protein